MSSFVFATASADELAAQLDQVNPLVRGLLHFATELKVEMRVYEGQKVSCKMQLPLKGDAYTAMTNAVENEQADRGSLVLVEDTDGLEETHEVYLDIPTMRQLLLMMK